MAKRFIFRLETVLKLRKQKEDECRRVVADRLRRVAEVKARIATHVTRLRETLESAREGQRVGALDPVQARRNRAYANAMHHLLARDQEELRRETERLREEQRLLTEASRDVKVIEKLRERQWQRHLNNEAREERLEADEIALQLHRRARGRRGRSRADAA